MILFLLVISVLSQQAGGPNVLNDAALRTAYGGQTHVSIYRHEVEEYGGQAFEETYHRDGTLDYQAGGVTLTGAWRVANGRICFDYPQTPLYGGCFIVAEDAGCYYSYQIGPDGAPVGLASGEWWIRAYIKGTAPDCAAPNLIS